MHSCALDWPVELVEPVAPLLEKESAPFKLASRLVEDCQEVTVL